MKPTAGNPIDLASPADVAYWTKALGITPPELAAAVSAVGPDSAKVSEFLDGGSRSEPPSSEQIPDGG